MDALQINTRPADHGACILELSGLIDAAGAERLAASLRVLEDSGRVKLVVACGALEGLSPEAAGIFLSHLVRIKKSGGDLRFCLVSDGVRATLLALGMSRLLEVCDTEAEAVAGFAESESPEEDVEDQGLVVERGEAEGGVVVLRPRGPIDRQTIGELDQALNAVLSEGKARILIDGSALTYMSSSGMGVFIAFQQKVDKAGGDLRFCRLSDMVRTVITTLGLHRLFRIFGERDEAVASFSESL